MQRLYLLRFRKTESHLYKRGSIGTHHTAIRMEPNADDVPHSVPGTPQSPRATNAPAVQTLPSTPESPRYSPVDITPVYEHSVRALYDRRVRMHQLDTFWAVMQSIASERLHDNYALTKSVETELRRCDQDQPIFPGKVVNDYERNLSAHDVHERYQQLCRDTNRRLGVLCVFYDAMQYYISNKSDRLADGMVATKLVEMVNRFRQMDIGP